MTTTTPPAEELSNSELGELLFNNLVKIERAMPTIALAAKELDDDDLEQFNTIVPALTAMVRTLHVASDEPGGRPITDDEVAQWVDGFNRLLWRAGGDPSNFTPPPDDDGDSDSWVKECAREDLQNELARRSRGWVIQVTTPVRQRHGKHVGFSWAYTQTCWYWGPTFYQALDAAITDITNQEPEG